MSDSRSPLDDPSARQTDPGQGPLARPSGVPRRHAVAFLGMAALAAAAGRIELIRAGHRARGWGDIGYHLIVDPLGNAWQGRPLIWQGAHVKDRNEGNIGILVVGNFEVGRPTGPQLDALVRMHERQQSVFQADPTAALQAITVGEAPRDLSLDPVAHAAMSGVCLAILNLDEALTRE